ncbi:hypothetical protein Kpho02_69720 [Kitasatospora phosalacinea]|uniref:Uncharacterized protein n=2 Tax=Kitasatospora phosalacinea TaxID=2065 RepID=A0A9W6V3R5_9ACTN|nr:hypothetical protein Kpho02_69720 [Kitasatospora phosalacinea]
MPSWTPWTVTHVVTTADRRFGPYLDDMNDLLDRAERNEWILKPGLKPVGSADEIRAALRDCASYELCIIDLPGAVDETGGAWLGVHPDGDFVDLVELASGTWNAAAVVLTNCHGSRDAFWEQLRRINARPFTAVGHFDAAGMDDHTPVGAVTAILNQADGGDEYRAFGAAWTFLGPDVTRPCRSWAVELLTPATASAHCP